MTFPPFKSGDRVKIKSSVANCYRQPFRRFADTGRAATVGPVYNNGAVDLRFDVKKGAQPQTCKIHWKDLEISHD